MDTSKLFIGEVYIRIKRNNQIKAKRVGYKAFYYVSAWDAYISLSKREEYYIEKVSEKTEGQFIKEGTIIPYSKFGTESNDKKVVYEEIKKEIERLVSIREEKLKNKKLKSKPEDIIITKSSSWLDKFQLAKNYYDYYKTLSVPQDFKTKNGVDYDIDGFNLDDWLCRQRQAFIGKHRKELSKEQKEKLLSIGFKISKNTDRNAQWMAKYELAKKYYEHFGNLELPYKFKTKDGITPDPNGEPLEAWVSSQRCAYKKNSKAMTQERIELLNKIGMIWSLGDNWQNFYRMASLYYELHDNLNIPENFKTLNGNDYDENGENLWEWINEQKKAFCGENNIEINDRQIKKLDDIQINWFDDEYDAYFQSQVITSENVLKIKKELLNRFKSYIGHFGGDTLPTKKIINKNFVKYLNRK